MYNYYIEMDLKNYMTVITNLSIIITFLYSIILIIDELYNIGIFSFKYTYSYNYGSFISNFNNIETIECETNRFNIYSNNNYIYKDIFTKSYFNYLIIIVITIITILFTIAYGINFYYTFIINQPEVCSFQTSTSFIKTIMKCLCDSCHEFIPNCTGNYFITFIIIIIIPLSYFLKSFLNIDITPNSTSTLFSFGYIILFIILLFSYSFILFNINKTDNNSTERFKKVLIYIFFTIIFISSAYIYKYIYTKYTDITLTKNSNPDNLYDIYKQSPPIKPRPISEPIYKGTNLLPSFKYDPKSIDIYYKEKKEIMDEYYNSIKNYEKDMIYYTQKYNNYINSKSALGDKTDYITIILNLLGLNNKLHIYIIGLLFFTYITYYFYNDDLLFICVVYLICILTILTIINAILYYNTILNKYIIYEPQAYYKNDITNANTKLNLLLDPSNGDGFYNILINNQIESKLTKNINTSQDIITSVKSLTIFDNFTNENISKINSNTQNIIIPNTNNIISYDLYDIYYSSGSSDVTKSITEATIKTHIFDKINNFGALISIDIFNYNYTPIKFIEIHYNDSKIKLENFIYYNRYVYYYSYLLNNLLSKLKTIYPRSKIDIEKYEDIFTSIIDNYLNYRLSSINDTRLTNNIKTNITAITSINTDLIDKGDKQKLTTNFFNILDRFINTNIVIINIKTLFEINTKVKVDHVGNEPNYHFIKKLDINDSNNQLTFTFDDITLNINYLKVSAQQTTQFYNVDIMDDPIKKKIISISGADERLFKYDSTTLYVKVPNKIIDSNDNELYIVSVADTPLTKIIFKETTKYTNIDADYKLNDINSYSYKFISADKINYTVVSPKTQFKAPYILKENNISTNVIDGFSKIILTSLLYNLIHITSKYDYKYLKQQLYFNTTTNPKIDIGKIERVNYDSFYIIKDFNIQKNLLPNNNKFYDINSDNNIFGGYIVLLYNVYTYNKDRIIDIIEYFIYNIKTYDNDKYSSDKYLGEQILSIKTQINKTVEKTDLIRLYENNKYIVNLILKIYENLIKYIKKEIQENIDITLCSSTSATNIEIEKQLYEHINKYFTITPGSSTYTSIFTINKYANLSNNHKNKIIEIGGVIKCFFNICIFLLNNINSNDTIQEENKETIISNFKFYNMDDTINLDISKIENIRRNLTINCDYYSKYNNLDKKQKLYMKTNADNVSYAFPVLLIIFIAIFGETAFIKS